MIANLAAQNTGVDGCRVLYFDPYQDDRGSFCEVSHPLSFKSLFLPDKWPQDNVSITNKGVIRGLHVQHPTKESPLSRPQGKLVFCLKGEVMDVCFDARLDSDTFGKHHMECLGWGKALYCPPGTLHGFYSLTDSILLYKCTTTYDPKCDAGVKWDDPDLGIDWGTKGPILSEKDRNLPTLRDYLESIA